MATFARFGSAQEKPATEPVRPLQETQPSKPARIADTSADGMYLRDDDEALNKTLREARAALSAKRFDDAADKFQAVVDAHVDQLVPWSVETLQSAKGAVKREVAAAAPELRMALATRYDGKARDELAAALRSGVDAELRFVADRYPFTTAGIAAEMRFGDLALESGDAGAAFASFRRLLDALPPGESGAQNRAEARAKAAIALSRLHAERGMSPAEWLAAIPSAERSRTIVVHGESRTLESFIGSLSSSTQGTTTWTGFLGGNSRLGAFALPEGKGWTLAWTFDHLRPLAEMPKGDDLDRLFGGADVEASLFPALCGRRLFAYNSRRAVCVDVESGKTLWYRDLAAFGSSARTGRAMFAGAASDDVFVLVHETGRGADVRRLLIALSARDGTTRWVRGGPEDEDEVVRPLAFSGAPVIAEGGVLLAAKSGREDVKAYGVGFDAETGATRFVRFLGSGPTTSTQEYFTETSESPTASYAAGRVFIGTGVGIVSALDPVTGEHLWCFRYERVPFRAGAAKARILAQIEPWFDDPLIARGGRLYTTPVDAGDLWVLLQDPDPASGLVSLCRHRKDNSKYLVGVRDGAVFLAGNDVADRVPEVSSLRPEGGAEEEVWPPFQVPNLPEERNVAHDDFVGRGAVAGDALLVPTSKTVYVVSSASGELLGEIKTKNDTLMAGNLPRSGSVVVCLEPGIESVFTVWGDRIQRFQRTP